MAKWFLLQKKGCQGSCRIGLFSLLWPSSWKVLRYVTKLNVSYTKINTEHIRDKRVGDGVGRSGQSRGRGIEVLKELFLFLIILARWGGSQYRKDLVGGSKGVCSFVFYNPGDGGCEAQNAKVFKWWGPAWIYMFGLMLITDEKKIVKRRRLLVVGLWKYFAGIQEVLDYMIVDKLIFFRLINFVHLPLLVFLWKVEFLSQERERTFRRSR